MVTESAPFKKHSAEDTSGPILPETRRTILSAKSRRTPLRCGWALEEGSGEKSPISVTSPPETSRTELTAIPRPASRERPVKQMDPARSNILAADRGFVGERRGKKEVAGRKETPAAFRMLRPGQVHGSRGDRQKRPRGRGCEWDCRRTFRVDSFCPGSPRLSDPGLTLRHRSRDVGESGGGGGQSRSKILKKNLQDSSRATMLCCWGQSSICSGSTLPWRSDSQWLPISTILVTSRAALHCNGEHEFPVAADLRCRICGAWPPV